MACKYTLNTLNALKVRFDLTHTEIKVDYQTGIAKLIDVNCRQHNIDLVPLTTMCIGYNALDMLVAAHFDKVVEPFICTYITKVLKHQNTYINTRQTRFFLVK